ncbi:ABC transporter ATP-binding protein [Terriglobus aquaticus]|uniref:ABC transporter ATP-binding protein n=1 Tax=Terriglobus aquaticus TaxID=940139 RepID=A0ABW9KM65_9BACT|nr:ABC transporter ATP-binding protein [Terriglobus aquaticus]
MRRIWRLFLYQRPYLFYTFCSMLLMAVVGAMAALRILLVKPIFDNILSAESSDRSILRFPIPHTTHALDLRPFVPSFMHNAWTTVAFILVLSAFLKAACDYAGTYLVNYAGFGMVTDLRNDLYNAVLRRSTAFFQRYTTGALLSTLINDIERVQIAMSSVLSDFLQQIFTLLFTAAIVIIYGGNLAWVLLFFVVIVITSARRIGRRVRVTTRGGQDKLAEIQNILHETLTGNRIVKAFGMELWEMARFRRAARRLFRANLRSIGVQALSSPLMDALASIAIALLLKLGRDRIVSHRMTAGSFITFLIAVFTLYDPVRKLAMFYNNFQQALGASEKIFQFLDEEDELPESPSAHRLQAFKESIQFRNVGFFYKDEEDLTPRPVLRSIDLTVQRGELIALVGPSGSGKSTLVNLIPRFFDPTSGTIQIDGHDLREVNVGSLRRLVGTVTQETVLFNDTVRNNIAYGQPNVSLDRVQAAARAALADDFISAMPDGYNTILGERGHRLSGGERQRIAIARALLKDAPILILDEATSALDAESESLVQQALANLMQDRTALVIAHRLSTVRRADRILVLEAGEIVECGTHAELVNAGGLYQRLYELQFDTGDASASPGESMPLQPLST